MHKCTTLTCQYSCKIFSRKKSNRDTVQKQHTNKLNRSRPFTCYQFVLKKLIALNSINKFKTLNCQLPGIFLKGKKSREALPKRIAHSSNTSRPFYLLSLRSKKIYSSELHEQIHDFDLSIHFTFFLKRKKSREKLHNHITQSLNTSCPFYLLSIRTKKIYSSEFHKQVHNFDLSNYFRFFLLLREMSRETVQKHVFHKPNTSRPFYL